MIRLAFFGTLFRLSRMGKVFRLNVLLPGVFCIVELLFRRSYFEVHECLCHWDLDGTGHSLLFIKLEDKPHESININV